MESCSSSASTNSFIVSDNESAGDGKFIIWILLQINKNLTKVIGHLGAYVGLLICGVGDLKKHWFITFNDDYITYML